LDFKLIGENMPQSYPKTYQAAIDKNSNLDRPEIFDPALKHFSAAYRLGDPILHNPTIRKQWLNARQKVIARLLQLINSSRWREHLVMRGSLLLKAWVGDIAREAGDIDWVFQPENITLKDPLSGQLFDELIQMMSENYQIENVTIELHKIAIDNIWTYERAEGRRIVFPWKVDGLPAGTLQMDVVFNEPLFDEPIQTPIPTRDGNTILVRSASPELSLAWKLLWLETDCYPQGKDLYDATILAETTQLPFELLSLVLQSNPDWKRGIADEKNFSWQSGFPWLMEETEYVDWENFKLEYPAIEGEAKDWQERLILALAPTFANL
jgi:Nucleotidyl transferase AbiEii toxin, Type IV TA system